MSVLKNTEGTEDLESKRIPRLLGPLRLHSIELPDVIWEAKARNPDLTLNTLDTKRNEFKDFIEIFRNK